MATENGVRTPNMQKAATIDYVMGNRGGSTRLVAVDNLAQQLLAGGPLRDALPVSGSNTIYYATKAEMEGTAVVLPPEQTGPLSAWVYADPVVENCGVYRYIPGPPVEWRRVLDLPLQWAFAFHGEGSAGDAIVATTPVPVSRSVLIALPIEAANEEAEPKVTFNGGDVLTIVSNSGNHIEPGGLVPPMMIWGYADYNSGVFRLINDQVATAIVASAEAAAALAVQAKGDAAAAMALAERFANAPEDEEVVPDSGLYSCRHWMAKAMDLGTGTALGEAAFMDVGTTAGTVAAGNDPRFDEILMRGVPIGVIVHSAVPLESAGFLRCNGAPCTSVWPDLRAALIADGSKYGHNGVDPLLPDEETANLFRRAAGGGLTVGTVQGDAIRNITGSLYYGGGISPLRASDGVVTGAFKRGTTRANATTGGATSANDIEFDASLVVPTASENRPKGIAHYDYIKAFGAVTIEGMADAAALFNALADKPTAEAGLDNTALMTALSVRWAIEAEAVRKAPYVSPEQTIVLNGTFTLTHGLGAEPSAVEYFLVCKTAEGGYTVGQKIRYSAPEFTGPGDTRGPIVTVTTTQLIGRFGAYSPGLVNLSTGAVFSLTPASWRLIVKAIP